MSGASTIGNSLDTFARRRYRAGGKAIKEAGLVGLAAQRMWNLIHKNTPLTIKRVFDQWKTNSYKIRQARLV